MSTPFFSRKRPLRVLTMNIWNFAEPYARRQKLLQSGLKAIDPDLMAFQEAGHDGTRHQVAEFLAGRGYHILHQFEVKPYPGMNNACCVASRWPLELAELCPLELTTHSRGYPYAALAVRVAAPDPVGSVLFVCAKPSWELNREYERELQAVALAQWITGHAARDGFPPILAGDFDATPDSGSIRFLTGKQSLAGTSTHFRDAWLEAGNGAAGYTWTTANGHARDIIRQIFHTERHARRIDYIFVGSFHNYARCARIRRCRVVLDRPAQRVWPSDHYAVYAEIDVTS